MKRIATLLSVTVATFLLSNCAYVPNMNFAGGDKDEQYMADAARSLYACRSYNYDPRSCR